MRAGGVASLTGKGYKTFKTNNSNDLNDIRNLITASVNEHDSGNENGFGERFENARKSKPNLDLQYLTIYMLEMAVLGEDEHEKHNRIDELMSKVVETDHYDAVKVALEYSPIVLRDAGVQMSNGFMELEKQIPVVLNKYKAPENETILEEIRTTPKGEETKGEIKLGRVFGKSNTNTEEDTHDNKFDDLLINAINQHTDNELNGESDKELNMTWSLKDGVGDGEEVEVFESVRKGLQDIAKNAKELEEQKEREKPKQQDTEKEQEKEKDNLQEEKQQPFQNYQPEGFWKLLWNYIVAVFSQEGMEAAAAQLNTYITTSFLSEPKNQTKAQETGNVSISTQNNTEFQDRVTKTRSGSQRSL